MVCPLGALLFYNILLVSRRVSDAVNELIPFIFANHLPYTIILEPYFFQPTYYFIDVNFLYRLGLLASCMSNCCSDSICCELEPPISSIPPP